MMKKQMTFVWGRRACHLCVGRRACKVSVYASFAVGLLLCMLHACITEMHEWQVMLHQAACSMPLNAMCSVVWSID